MVLLIFESISTTEVIIIGIIALVVFGPRKLPELFRKGGKLMAEFRSATNEFKSTWEKEVSLAELKDEEPDNDSRMLAFLENPKPVSNSISRGSASLEPEEAASNGHQLELPSVKEVSPDEMNAPEEPAAAEAVAEVAKETKKDWL